MDVIVPGIILLAGVVFMTFLAVALPCKSEAGCEVAESGTERWFPMVSSCEAVFRQIAEQKRHLENRVSMMNELIERADRQIEEMHERIAAIGERRELTDTERQMLDLLRAGGFDREEISRFSRRSDDELTDAA
jgi:hypothetical protein